MIDRIHCISLSHRHARIDVRERIHTITADLHDIRARCVARFDAVVNLKTCGRFEIYVETDKRPRAAALKAILNIDSDAILDLFDYRSGRAVVSHLMQVASGLDSPLPGEDHVLGQVRNAYMDADDQGTVGPLLSALFRGAIACGRRVRHDTQLRSMASTYADEATAALPSSISLSDQIMILGSGALAHELGAGLRKNGFSTLEVVSRHQRRGQELARLLNAKWWPLEELGGRMVKASVVICCTAARKPIVTRDIIKDLDCIRCIIDLGMPRNVDREVRSMHKGYLDIDGLTRARHLANTVQQQADVIVEQETDRYLAWLTRRAQHRRQPEFRRRAASYIENDEAAA